MNNKQIFDLTSPLQQN